MLRDADGDGRMDVAEVWAEDLPPVYGLVPARGGVIVACAPDIIFLADHDGDGRAEVRDKLFSGHRLEQPGESRPGATCGSAVARDCRPLALCPARTPRVATSRSRSSGVAREHRCQLGGQSCIVQQQRLVGPQARKAKADAGAFRCRSVRPSHHPALACRLSDAFVKISTVRKSAKAGGAVGKNKEARSATIGIVLALCLTAYAGAVVLAAPEAQKRALPWDVLALSQTPKVHPTTERPAKGMRSFFYEGADYKGKPTWVFAYYATPEGNPPEGGWPAVVCAHGGGGTAFPAWVTQWNKNGYAALAMDLEGHLPGGNFFGVEGNHPPDQGHENAGPKRISWFGDIALPDNEQWFYHAVADVIRAQSLLRSFPEINPKKIGLTGISWGGVIASTVAGVDPRFAFVVPVYGGAFIRKHEMNPEQYSDYCNKWDPSAHLPHAQMPMLWVSSFTEPVFPVNLFSKAAETAAGTSILCIRPWLPHGHGFGWEEVWEITAFANSIAKTDAAMAKIEPPQIDPTDGLVHAKCTGDIKNAVVGFTTATGEWKNQALSSIPCSIGKGEVIATQKLPENTSAFIINANDNRDACVNSVLTVVKP